MAFDAEKVEQQLLECRSKVAQMAVQLSEVRTANRGMGDIIREQEAENRRLQERVKKLERGLELILPLAKGYAAAHPVGSNARYVQIAHQALPQREAQGQERE